MAQKLDVKRAANTLAIVTAIAYIICIVLLWAAPNFATVLGNYLFHGVDISNLIVFRGIGYSIVSLILGTISGWLLGALFALVYNKFS